MRRLPRAGAHMGVCEPRRLHLPQLLWHSQVGSDCGTNPTPSTLT